MFNSRHPNPRRVWKGGSEQHLLTPLPGIPRARVASSQKMFFVYSFMNLTHFSVKDVQFQIKSTNIDKIHKIHAPKIQGRVFPGKKSASGKHIDHGVLGGTLKSTKNYKIHKLHAPKFQGVFFLRSPKRRRQLGHRRTGLGDPETDEICPFACQNQFWR